jgi:hypothetical protein
MAKTVHIETWQRKRLLTEGAENQRLGSDLPAGSEGSSRVGEVGAPADAVAELVEPAERSIEVGFPIIGHEPAESITAPALGQAVVSEHSHAVFKRSQLQQRRIMVKGDEIICGGEDLTPDLD